MAGNIKGLISKSGFRESINVVPFRQDMPAVLSGLDILFFPSLWEGFSLLLLEAQATGLPCVCLTEPYSEEAIPPEMKKFRVKTGDVGAAVEKLLYLAEHPEILRELGISGYNHVGNFTVQSTVEKIQKFYTNGLK